MLLSGYLLAKDVECLKARHDNNIFLENLQFKAHYSLRFFQFYGVIAKKQHLLSNLCFIIKFEDTQNTKKQEETILQLRGIRKNK